MLLISLLLLNMLRPELYDVEVVEDVVYGNAWGYWSESDARENDFAAQAVRLFKTGRKRYLNLEMDIYIPVGNESPRPLVLLMHGGAFFANNKGSMPVSGICRSLAQVGCVAVSVNYRMGFSLTKASINETQSDALEDASAALEFMLNDAGRWNIDTSKVFIGGASSGAITALKLAAEKNDSGIIGVIDMWGGIEDLSLLDSCDAAILALHGDRDKAVPFYEGYPLGGKMYMNYMYGSSPLIARRKEQGRYAKLVVFPGCGHAPYRDRKHNIVPENYQLIVNEIISFVTSSVGRN